MANKRPSGKPNGRPPKVIDQKTFEALCKIQCTEEEIKGVLDVSADTLIKFCRNTYGDTFSKIYKKLAEGGKSSLRRMQWKLAEKNASMAIWLGKQYLGQTDKNEDNAPQNQNVPPITINFRNFKEDESV